MLGVRVGGATPASWRRCRQPTRAVRAVRVRWVRPAASAAAKRRAGRVSCRGPVAYLHLGFQDFEPQRSNLRFRVRFKHADPALAKGRDRGAVRVARLRGHSANDSRLRVLARRRGAGHQAPALTRPGACWGPGWRLPWGWGPGGAGPCRAGSSAGVSRMPAAHRRSCWNVAAFRGGRVQAAVDRCAIAAHLHSHRQVGGVPPKVKRRRQWRQRDLSRVLRPKAIVQARQRSARARAAADRRVVAAAGLADWTMIRLRH